jgi:predicted HTH transcriptional regulator
MISDEELRRIVGELLIAKTDSQEVAVKAVKASAGKLPASIVESVSTFTNASDGTVVLVLSKKKGGGFEPSKGFTWRTQISGMHQITQAFVTS